MIIVKGKKVHVEKHHVNLYPYQYEALRRRAFEKRTSVSKLVQRAVNAFYKLRSPTDGHRPKKARESK